jgi:hypothetical protein
VLIILKLDNYHSNKQFPLPSKLKTRLVLCLPQIFINIPSGRLLTTEESTTVFCRSKRKGFNFSESHFVYLFPLLSDKVRIRNARVKGSYN